MRSPRRLQAGASIGPSELQLRGELAGGGQPVLVQAVVGQFDQLLDLDSGVAQELDDIPGLQFQRCPSSVRWRRFPGAGVVGPDTGLVLRLPPTWLATAPVAA